MSITRIAEQAGVSIATVSRVLNNSRPVNPAMAALVHQAVQELQLASPKYQRARSKDHNGTIALLSLGESDRGWFEVPIIAAVVAALSRAAHENEMELFVTEMPNLKQLGLLMRRSRVDGAIVFVNSPVSREDVEQLGKQLPVVAVMGGQWATTTIDYVGVDNHAVGRCAAEYLIGQGLRHINYYTIEPTWDICRLRAQGFLAASQEAGVMPTVYLQAEPNAALALFGREVVADSSPQQLVRSLVKSSARPFGLFASRDDETADVYRLLAEEGLEIGRDVMVVSCDNEAVRLASLHPRPATIDLVAPEIARHAIRRLASRMKHRDEPQVRILVTPRLILPGEEPTDPFNDSPLKF